MDINCSTKFYCRKRWILKMGKTLQLLARLFYCSSATSAETERVFSLSKFVDTALRQSLSDTKLELHYYCIGGQDCAQDAELTSFILAALLECLARKSIKKLHLLSDGARTFQSMEFLNRVHTLKNYNRTLGLHGIQIVDCSFTEAGEGKSELDGSFAVISRLVREYALAVGQVTTPVELRKCLQVKLQGSEKHILLHLRQKNFYENLYKTHTSFADNPLQLYDEDVGSYIFNSAESFTRYKRWVLHENYAVLQTASHADLSLASFWQRSSKGWLHVPNPPSPIEKPTTPQRPVRAAASFKRSPSLPPSNAPTSLNPNHHHYRVQTL